MFTYTEIKKHVKVGGRIYTDAPLTPEEKEDFRQQLIKEQNEFLEQYRAVGDKLDKAMDAGDIRTVEKCREYFYDIRPVLWIDEITIIACTKNSIDGFTT